MSHCDILAFGAHPDDAELGVGGQLHKAAKRGFRVVIADLTRGEMGTRGTPEERAVEAAQAAELLGVSARINAGLPDAGLADSPEQREAVIRIIREHRPRTILAPMKPDRHPDHEAAHDLIRSANFYSGLAKVDTGQPPYRAPALYFYYAYFTGDAPPAFVVDVSGHFDQKLSALRAYRSQLFNPERDEPQTFVSTEEFWEDIATRALFWGARIGVRYGEPLYHFGPVGLELPLGLEGL
ncbi:MAG: bacillithiol biosynthesis deacetylase BshB1 [Candidatus Hydrogenedens sp.]|nr:bacillithiol biosynthesis deacetylase BshB1 [Candidatus Hydrogenedens sp.]